jgi:cytochrome c-type biogenesis protein CcmH/NrfF
MPMTNARFGSGTNFSVAPRLWSAAAGRRFSQPRLASASAAVVLCRFVAASLLLLFLASAPLCRAQQTPRAKALGQKLLCVCGCNQGLVACNHVGCTTSHAMLKELDDRVARGDSDDLILQSFVQEYGLTVLAEPPAKGFNWVAWVIPVLVPFIALYIVWEVVRRWRQRAALAPAGGPQVSAEMLDRARHESQKESNE